MAAVLWVAVPTHSAIARRPEPAFPARMLNGLETVRQDETKITVFRGSATDNTGRYLITIDRSLTADLMAVGDNGRDDKPTAEDLSEHRDDLTPDDKQASGFRATYRNTHPFAGKPLAGWYMPVYAATAEGAPKIFLTRQQSSQRIDRDGDAAVPAEFVARRNAPIAHYYDPEHGIRPMQCYGWPKPFCVWTRVPPYEAGLEIANLTGPKTFAEIDARSVVPPTGRLLRALITVKGETAGGSVRVATLPRGDGLLVGHVNAPGDIAVTVIELALTSTGMFHISADSGVSVGVTALGFSMLQPN